LFIAKGSAAELRTQLYIAVSIGMISQEAAEQLIEITKKISSMLQKLISFQKTKL
jgi:four helix bundle protein